MDGREFEVIADVVGLLLTPGPHIETVADEGKLLLESENEDVEDARQLFAVVRQQLVGLRAEALEVGRCLGLDLKRSRGSRYNPLNEQQQQQQQQRGGGAEIHSFRASVSSASTAAPLDDGAAATTMSAPEILMPTSSAGGGVRPRGSGSIINEVATAGGENIDHPSTNTTRSSTLLSTTREVGGDGTTDGGGGVSVRGSADFLPVLTAMREHLAGEAISVATTTTTTTTSIISSATDTHHFYASTSTHLPAAEKRTATQQRGGSNSSGISGAAARLSSQHRRQTEETRRDQLTLLLRWVQDQEAGALATYERIKATLLAVKAAAGKQQVSRSASRVLVQLDRIVWQLCTPEKTPFVQAELHGLTFDRHRNRDHSGRVLIVIYSNYFLSFLVLSSILSNGLSMANLFDYSSIIAHLYLSIFLKTNFFTPHSQGLQNS